MVTDPDDMTPYGSVQIAYPRSLFEQHAAANRIDSFMVADSEVWSGSRFYRLPVGEIEMKNSQELEPGCYVDEDSGELYWGTGWELVDTLADGCIGSYLGDGWVISDIDGIWEMSKDGTVLTAWFTLVPDEY